MATPDWSERCGTAWLDARRELPAPPRLVLTGEHLFDPEPIWALGTNPFNWRAGTSDERTDLVLRWGERVPELAQALEAV